MSDRNLDIQRNTSLSEQTTLITNPETVSTGKKTIATPGDEAVLTDPGILRVRVTVKDLSTNTDVVFIGNSSLTSANGFQLAAGEQVFIPVGDLNQVYVDVTVGGEGVTYIGN